MLRLTEANFKDDGVHVTPHKTEGSTGKKLIIDWSPELRQAIDQAKAVRPVISPLLFCSRRGEGYINEVKGTASGWDSMWQRFMERILSETNPRERFTEHDMRAKCASDAETLEHARALLAHADSRVTDRNYRRAPERVSPAKRKV